MKIVRFENGKYAIRTFWFFGWNFLDLTNPRFNWTRRERHFKDCVSSLEKCLKIKGECYQHYKYEIVPEERNC